MNVHIDARIKGLTSLMYSHVFMGVAGCAAVVACVLGMANPSVWTPILFAVNVVLLRLNAGRYLVLKHQRNELIKLRTAFNEAALRIKAKREESNG